MNLREGKIGAQEGAAAAGIAIGVSGIFVTDNMALYQQGNGAYVEALFSMALALGVFALAACAMKRKSLPNLFSLLQWGLGGLLGRLTAILLCGVLVVAAAGILARFVLMLNRFVFVEAEHWQLLLYLAPTAGLLCWMGLETIGRTARIFCWVVLAALLGTLLLGTNNYAPFRLFPFAEGKTVLELSLRGIFCFFPGLLGLLIAADGLHGLKTSRKAGLVAAGFGGGTATLAQLCLGMTYSYQELARMHSPMYRITMTARSGGYFPRLDKLLLFGWTIAGVMGAGFYQYAAALLWCRAFGQRDARPAAVVMSGLSAGICLLAQQEIQWLMMVGEFLSQYGFLLAAGPVMLAAAIGLCRKGRADMERKEEGCYEQGR